MTGDIHPWVTEGLLHYGLITQEQADEANRRYEQAWELAWENSRWWQELANIAWSLEASWWSKFLNAGVPSFRWKDAWLREKRGW